MRKIRRVRLIKYCLIIITFFLIFIITFTLNNMYISKHTELLQVAVATKDIPAYSTVLCSDVILEDRPKSLVPEDAITNPVRYFQDKTYYTKELGYGKGDIIRESRMSFGHGDSEIDPLVKYTFDSKMMISVNTDLVRSCSNIVAPGTYVDAIVFIEGKGFNGKELIISPIEDERLSNLLVIDKKNSISSEPVEKGREAVPAVITLVLDRDNLDTAKALVEYNEKGKIYLLPVGFQSQIFLTNKQS